MTRHERAVARRKIRQLKTVGRGRAIIQALLEALGATTTYAEREPRRREKLPQTELYGSHFELKPNGLYDGEGKPTGHTIVRVFSAQPGEIVTSRGGTHTNAPLTRYMVRPDRSLRKI